MTFKQTLNSVKNTLGKHSPSILTGVGIAGLATTAYLAYKSRNKVEEVVVELERKRELEIEVNKVELVRDFTEALYLPVVVGMASIGTIVLAQNIQNKRIAALAGALAAEQARNILFEAKYRKQHGDEAYNKFVVPTQQVTTKEIGKNGKVKTNVQDVKTDIDHSIGQWYDESTEYVADDHTYNLQMIKSVHERMQSRLFQRGTLLLNEVREELGLERIRTGALLGWTAADNFDIDTVVTNLVDEETGEIVPQIWVTWSRAKYIYDEVEFEGRYSIY